MAAVMHHLPPEPGVTEIRVHGVGGTSPESLLEQRGITQVTGDDTAGMFRGATGPEGRTVEAYSWGGLTARSRSRAFWVVLLPFSLVNLAGWMVEPSKEGGLRRTTGIRWHEAFVQIVAVLTTAAYVSAFALVSMNVVALQCGSVAACRESHWYLAPLGTEAFAGHPGRRVLLGMVVPLALLAGFLVLAVVSSRRYDDFGTSSRDLAAAPDEATGTVLGLPDFWFPSPWQRRLVSLHLAAPLLLLGGLLARSSVRFEKAFGVAVVPDAVANAVAVVALLTGVALLAGLGVATWRAGDRLLVAPAWFEAFARAVLAVAVAVAVAGALLTWRLDVADGRLRTAASPAEAAWGLWGFGWAPVLLLAAGAGFVGLFSVVQLWRWFVWRRWLFDQFAVVVMVALVMSWPDAVTIALGGAGVAVLAQWGPTAFERLRPGSVTGEGPALWRLWTFLAVCAAAVVVRLATDSAAAPWGPGWPRLTPVLLFTAVLTVMLATATVRLGDAPLARVVAVTAAVPLGVLGVGALLAWRFGVTWLYAAAWLAWVALSIVWLARFRFDAEPRWRWNGPSAVATLALALVLGVFSGVVIRVADHLDGDGEEFVLRATAFYEWTALGFTGIVLVLAAGAGIWVLSLTLGVAVGPDGARVPKVERLCEAVRAGDVVVTMASLLLGMALLPLVTHLGEVHGDDWQAWIGTGAPTSWRGVVDAASWVAVGVAFAILLSIRRGLRDSEFRTKVGIVWDLATFWPRSFHPFAPPAYATRAVPELQARLAEVGAGGGATVLSGHSQGSVVSVAAVASLRPELRRRVALVTHGSPLARFYERYFPRYFPAALFDRCAATLAWADEPADGAWLNLWRRSDPIADPVFAGRTLAGAAPADVASAVGAPGPDVVLDDPLPQASPYVLPATPALRRHSGYMADPRMVATIETLARRLRL